MTPSEFSGPDLQSAPRNAWLCIVLLVLLCAPLFLFRLGRAGLGDPDEGRNAEVAREILENGDWVTPHMNGISYLDKPPAFFWTVALSYRLLGVSELAARAPSALFALAGIALVSWFARRRSGEAAGWLAGITLALSPLYIIFGRIVIFDMMLAFCMTVSVLSAFEAIEGGGYAGASAADTGAAVADAGGRPHRRLPGALFFAAAGLGTITKGPVALAVPLLVAITWALIRRRPARLKRLGFASGAAIYAVIVVPWLVLVEMRNPGYLHYAIVGENLQRMTSNRFETARPFYFYAKVVLPGFFPWIVYAAVAGLRRARALFPPGQRAAEWRRACSRLAAETDAGRLVAPFAGCWLAVLLLFFSCVASKRPAYMVPCAAPLALLSGRLWAGAFGRRPGESSDGLSSGARWVAALCAAAAMAAILAGPAGMALGYSDGKYDSLLSRRVLFGGTAAGLAAACVSILMTRSMRRPVVALASAALSIAVIVPLAHAAGSYLDVARSSRPVSRFLAARLRPEDGIVCYEQYRPGLNFYLRRPIQLLTTGTPFSSWYIKMHLDEFSRDPSFPIITRDELRSRLAAPSPAIYVLSPPRMYDLLRAEAGPVLRRDPIYEDPGGGLFVRTTPP